jgi:quinoprotein glucose dehydrogenase
MGKRPVAFLIWVSLGLLVAFVFVHGNSSNANNSEWPNYGRDPGGQRYSPLTDVNRSNVAGLKVAWTFRTGDAYQPKNGNATRFEETPLFVDGTLYTGTPLGRVIALDPATGKQRWAYDSHIDKELGYGDYSARGVSTWNPQHGSRRIYIATIDARLIALDAATGKPCTDFGDNGSINLRQGLRIPVRAKWLEDYEETSAPAVIGDTIVIGSAIADNGATDQPSGEVRAFDAQSGKLKWKWDPIPQDPHAVGADTWKNGSAARTGAANAWSTIAADPARNLVFIPTGSPSPDYYGGERLGDNLFANSVVALKADTGERVWHFQTVHHDLWDYDVATPPLLFDAKQNGGTVPAIAIGSKTGNLFLLNRETGKPLFGVEERPVAKSEIPGETAAATQPFPVKPAPISTQHITAQEAWGVDDADRKWCSDEMNKLRTGDIFTPPSLQGTLQMPGNIGGMNWGGMAYDPAHDLLILPQNHIAAEVRLIPRADYEGLRSSKGRKLDGDWEFAPQHGTPYGMMRRLLVSPKRIPCTAPPWGTLLAINTRTGDKAWEVPLGQLYPTLPAKYGSISLGGPIATAGGIVFVAGTLDPAIYAFDVESGKQLWKGTLPTSARATPMTYKGPDGKQYVVISAGSHKDTGMEPLGDYLVAFSL